MTKPPRRPNTPLRPANMYPRTVKPYTYKGDQPYTGPGKQGKKAESE